MKVRFSRFLEEKEINNMMVVFHRLDPTLLYFKKEDWEFLKKNSLRFNRKAKELLIKQGLIVRSNDQDSKKLEVVRENYKKNLDQVKTLYLVLTHDCNLMCKYCFVARSFCDKEVLMKPEIARKGIDLWINHLRKNTVKGLKYFIIFYGGEPLMNWITLKSSLEYIEKLGLNGKAPKDNLEIVVTTNGILLNRNIMKQLRDYRASVTVSLDGQARVHDKCRMDKDGKGTFKKTVRAIEMLKETGVKVYVSMTITPFSFERAEKIARVLERLNIDNFGLNRLVGRSLFYLTSEMSLKDYDHRAADESIKRFIAARKRKVLEDRTQEKIEAFYNKDFYLLDCNGYGEQIVIQPDGWVSNCHASAKYNIMHIDDWPRGLLIGNISRVKDWRKRLPLYNEECLNCEAVSICGGGCPWGAAERTGDSFKKDKSFCVYTKKLFEFILKEDCKRNKIV